MTLGDPYLMVALLALFWISIGWVMLGVADQMGFLDDIDAADLSFICVLSTIGWPYILGLILVECIKIVSRGGSGLKSGLFMLAWVFGVGFIIIGFSQM